MPLEQRVIQPIGVGRGCVPMDSSGNLAINIPNEMECVTNGTLANIIRQLSSLSRYAEDLFASILSDATVLIARSSALQTRIDRLASKVVSLDSSVEEVSLQDIHLRKAFKSSQQFDQQVVSRASIPASIQEVYLRCAPPPPLNKLNSYRDDGKDGLKFYTDPNYFFELWRQDMLDQTERVLADKVRKVPKKTTQDKKQRKVRAPNNSRERIRQMMTNQGEFIIETKNGGPPMLYIQDENTGGRPNSLEVALNYQQMVDIQQKNNYYKYHSEVIQLNQYNQQSAPYESPQTPQQSSTPTRRQQSITSRPSQPPPAPPSAPSSGPSTPQHTMGRQEETNQRSRVRETLPPPPPPPPAQMEPNSGQSVECEKANIAVEPPPPPPPPPSGHSTVDSKTNSKPTQQQLLSIQLKKTPLRDNNEPKSDARSDLLAAIREGIKLKRVEDCKQREVEKSTPLHDVASILARRVAIELSDSEGGAEEDDDSDAWDDESEC